MRGAAQAGAGLINDVRALREPGALQAAGESGLPVCLMHMQGEPRTMQADPCYGEVVTEVRDFLAARVAAAEEAGIARERIVLDPGFGFGKTLGHNLELLRRLDELRALGRPLLVGVSRKSMVGSLLDGRAVEGRVHGSVAAALIAAQRGAAILRVHDVGPTVDALRVWQGVEGLLED
jgi:dihydropteroate synthase